MIVYELPETGEMCQLTDILYVHICSGTNLGVIPMTCQFAEVRFTVFARMGIWLLYIVCDPVRGY